MQTTDTLNRPARSIEEVAALLRARQAEECERLKALAADPRVTDAKLAHLARQIGLRSTWLATLYRQQAREES